MNFLEALKEMKNGCEAKHINHVYWKKLDLAGYIVNVPDGNCWNPEFYSIGSDEWEIKPIEKEIKKPYKKENLTFGQALKRLKQGHKLTRACWNRPEIYIYLKTTNQLYEIRVITIQGFDCPWMPNHRELLECDWKVVE